MLWPQSNSIISALNLLFKNDTLQVTGALLCYFVTFLAEVYHMQVLLGLPELTTIFSLPCL